MKREGEAGVARSAAPQGDSTTWASADPERRARIERVMAEIDLADSHSIMFFGSRAQEKLTGVSDSMLEGVRNEDAGAAGGALGEMVATLRGFDPKLLDPARRRGLLARVLGPGKPVVKFLQRYEEVRRRIDGLGDDLEAHKTRLMGDIVSLDRLYAANLEYFHELAIYIAAGDETLRRIDEENIPAIERRARDAGDLPAAQELRDLRGMRDDLERRVHDLKLTRQVAMQSLPSIRLVQENDKSLVAKITSVLVNTVPLWRTQLAQAVTIWRSREAGATLKDASDLTNELLLANAETLRQANAEVRREVERGVFDIEAVKAANDHLIATIEESLEIVDEGRRKRLEAQRELAACEESLRNALASARSREGSMRQG